MSIVAFDKIGSIRPQHAGSLSGGVNGSTPVSPVLDVNSERSQIYDPLWGYFIFGQSIEIVYGDDRTYRDTAVFTISGTFTIGAELGVHDSNTIAESDTVRFNTLINKFKALEAALVAAANADAPINFLSWGGASDPRTVALPEPLRDKNGAEVWAFPESIDILPGRFTESLTYHVTLREAKVPAYKLRVNNTILDNATLSIQLPAPILHRTRAVACAGEILQVENYTVLECEATGSIPNPDSATDVVGPTARSLFNEIDVDGTVNLNVLRKNQSDAPQQDVRIFSLMDVDAGTGFEAQVQARQTAISIRMKSRT
jgi:hypothetical protein